MHRLVPDLILEQWAPSTYRGTLDCASLFVDISGFTTITDALSQHGQHGAEVLAGAMRAVFAPLVESVYAQGGLVAFFAGDAFTKFCRPNAPVFKRGDEGRLVFPPPQGGGKRRERGGESSDRGCISPDGEGL